MRAVPVAPAGDHRTTVEAPSGFNRAASTYAGVGAGGSAKRACERSSDGPQGAQPPKPAQLVNNLPAFVNWEDLAF